MIQATIFDLDGTLIASEQLKAQSYARAAVELCPHSLDENTIMEMFKEVVGLSRREVALQIIERFGLEEAARAHMAEHGVETPWQAFVQVRLNIYEEMLQSPEIIRTMQWPHNIELLRTTRDACGKVGLATMSYCAQARRILEILGLLGAFDFIATRDDVENGKPDPEIYLLVAHELGVAPEACLVIEDSPTGVQAALAAGMDVIAVTTPFTRPQFRDGRLLDRCRVVDDPATLPQVVQQRVEAHHTAKQHGG